MIRNTACRSPGPLYSGIYAICFADESPRHIYKPFLFKRPGGTRRQSNVYSGEFVENGNNSPNTIIMGSNIDGDAPLVD